MQRAVPAVCSGRELQYPRSSMLCSCLLTNKHYNPLARKRERGKGRMYLFRALEFVDLPSVTL